MLEAHPGGTRPQVGLGGGAQGPGVSSVVVVFFGGGGQEEKFILLSNYFLQKFNF